MCHGSLGSPEYSASSALPVCHGFCCHNILELLRVVAGMGHIKQAKSPRHTSGFVLLRYCPSQQVSQVHSTAQKISDTG
jgi:hypothetical protein